MVKTIIKEIIITILLITVIGLLLAILLYGYVPTNKVVPANVVAYEMPEEIRNEIANVTANTTENIVRTYSIDAQDLEGYQRTNCYDKGKENPFAIGDYDGATETEENGNSNNNSATNNSTEASTSNSTSKNEVYKGK